MPDPATILGGINAAANVAGVVGGFMGGGPEGLSRADQRFMAHQQWTLARDQFERGIQTRVKDSEAAGLHPLAALGAMPSGSSIPGGFSGSDGPSLGDRLQNMGQNVSRAIQAQQQLQSRALLAQQLENEKAQGDFIRAQTAESIARAKNLSLPPAMPSGGTDRFGFSSTGDAMGIGNKHVLIKNPDGSFSLEESPQYGSTLYHRPMSSMGRDLLTIMRDAYRGTKDIYTNTIGHRPPRKSWKSEL